MKKICAILISILLLSTSILFCDQFTDFQAEISNLSYNLTTSISSNTYKNMGFYTGAGNVSPANTSGFLGLKAGLGIGASFSPLFLSNINNPTNIMNLVSGGNSGLFNLVGQAFSLLPMPYDFVSVKIGVPVIPLDVGVRIGILPNIGPILNGVINNVLPGSYVTTGAFHIGAEVRYCILDLAIFKLDGRVSFDIDNGSIGIGLSNVVPAYVNNTLVGTNTTTFNLGYSWNGTSIGAKVVAGVNLPLVGGVWAGGGININSGSIKTSISSTNTLKLLNNNSQDLSVNVNSPLNYDPFDIRLLAGAQLLFINIAGEISLLSQNIGVTIVPVYIVF